MALRLTLALLMLVVTVAVAGRRIVWLVKLIRSGKADKGRTDEHRSSAPRTQVDEVFGQKQAAEVDVPGHRALLHVLGLRHPRPHDRRGATARWCISQDFAFPFFGHARWLGFLEDFFAVAVLRRRSSGSRSTGCATRPSASSAAAASTARTPARPGSSSA